MTANKLATAELEQKKEELFQEFQANNPLYLKGYAFPAPKEAPNLKNVDISKKKMAKINMNNMQKSVLCGTITADSSIAINVGYKNARVQNRHSTRQAAWFFWKWMVCLSDFHKGLSSITLQNSDGFQSDSNLKAISETIKPEGSILNASAFNYLGKLKVMTGASTRLTELHDILCENGIKKIERKWLNHMTDYFLMTLWLDDGSLAGGYQGYICLDSTPKDQQEILVDYLEKVWGIKSYTFKNGEARMGTGQYKYRIKLKDQYEVLKYLRIIGPIIPVKEMLYKILFVPINNTDLLQRWASEVTELVLPEFRDYVRDFYVEKPD
jgi:hypothetical protein